MKNIKYLFIAVFTLIMVNSCTKFSALNTDPNVPTTVSPDMLATQVLKGTFRFWNPNATDFSTGNLWCKHTALLQTNPNPYQYYYSYWPYGDFGGYKYLTDLKRMVEYSAGNAAESSYKGLALFLKAWIGFQNALDMGDVPYSEAGKAEDGITQPTYDKQSDVFAEILTDLILAEADFAAGTSFDGDIMYNGDATKWRKLCNTFQLKVIQTINKKVTADQKARFAAIVAANNLMVDNTDNFQLTYTENPNAWHPFYNGEGTRIYDGVSKLVVDALRNFNDRRLFYFAEPSQYLITGGLLESDFAAYEGAPTELSADQLALNNQAGKYSLVNKRYVTVSAGDPMIKLSYAEQCFIIAEAIEEGWVSGNAQTYYESGVKDILNYYMNLPSAATGVHGMAITQSYIDNYFSGAAAYATAGTKTQRELQIWTQRWLIDFFQGNGLNYPQFLRTGYPNFPLDPNTSMDPDDKTVYPQRWKYPTEELVTNPVNYKKAIDDQFAGYDGINKIPWYLQ